MGGKQKAQRTKGNVKPSSSGRSAALLGNVSLPAFPALKDNIFPSFQNVASDDLDPNIDPNFQLVLKKMNKKDAITRIKALQEFSKLVENSDLDTLKPVLHVWPRLYCTLAGDVEHKVREAANDAHRIVVVSAKRNVAPYLRMLAGPWFVAQFDTYAPAASAAVRSFQDAFPSGKQMEAIVFCQEEILKFISDNLLDQTLLIDNNERPEKQDRNVVMCLQGYCHFLKIMSEDILTKELFLKISADILQADQFWNLAVDKIPLVRSSWLAVLTLMLEKVPNLLTQHHKRVVNCIVGRLDDEDPVVLPYLWQTALTIFVVVDDWSSYCKVDSQIIPALWRLLRGGGYGCANAIFPNMLPLLSSLLKVIKTDKEKQAIVDLFFQSLREGFNKKNVQQSRSESESIAQTYLECIRYVGKQNLMDSKLIVTHLIPVLEDVTTENNFNLLSKGIFEHTSSLLHYWSSDESDPQYDNLCVCFWDSLNEAYKRILKQHYSDTTTSYILNKQIEFCLCLKDNRKFRNKNFQKVRFHPDTDSESSVKIETKLDVTPFVHLEKHKKYLQKFVYTLAMFYLEKVTEEKNFDYVIPMCKLLVELNDPEVFCDLIRKCSFLEIFSTLFGESRNTDSPIFLQSVMEFFFSIVKHLEVTDAEKILKLMCQNPDILLWLLRIVKREKSQSFVLQWLRSTAFSEQLMTMSKSVSDSGRLILMECMGFASDGAFLVNISTICSILSELMNKEENFEKAKFAANFLSTLLPLLSQGEKLLTPEEKVCLSSSTHKLVYLLFCMCCETEKVPENIIFCLSSGWQDGVNILTTLNVMDRKSIITNLSSVVWKKVVLGTISTEDVNNLINISINLINLLTSCQLEMTGLFLDYIISDYKLMEEKMRRLCDNVELILGAYVHTWKDEGSALTESEIEQYILLSVFILKLLVNIILIANTNEETKEDKIVDSEKTNTLIPVHNYDESEEDILCVKERENTTLWFKSCQKVVETISHIALAVTVCDVLESNFQYMAFYDKIHSYILEVKSKFSELLASCKEEERESLFHLSLDRAKQNGGVCVNTVYLVSSEEKWSTVHTHFLDSPFYEYSYKIFLSKAGNSNTQTEIENLGVSTNFILVANYLKFTQSGLTDRFSSEIKNFISEWKNEGSKALLYDCDVSEESFQCVEKILRKIQFLSVCVKKCPHLMEQDVWDFIIISAAYYTQNLKYLQKYYSNSDVAENILFASSLGKDKMCNVSVFSVGVFDFLISIYEFCQSVKTKQCPESNFDHISEWHNVFADDVHLILSKIYISLPDALSKTEPSLLGNIFLQKLCEAIMVIYEDISVCGEHTKKLEKEIRVVCCKLIHSSISPLQISAYSILKNLILYIVNKDTELMSNESLEDNFNDTELEIYDLLSILSEVQSVVVIMLAEFSFGDSCIVQPHTDTYSYTAAYLLLWDVVLKACEFANSELRYQYANIIRNKGYLSTLLNNLFYLMPAEVLETTVPKITSTSLTTMFSELPDIALNKRCTSLHLQHLACWVYYCVVSRLPALVRQWWSDTKPKTSSLVQRATVQYVTPLLCSRELQSIQNQTTKFKNMEVKVHGKAREVVAVYAIDEAQMELVITLPEEYPLAAIQVDSHSSSLVGTSQWRNWVKQLSIFLTHQNGSLWDGLLLWKSNLDKRFEGVEECYICFSILHGTNFQIPKLCCKTCKKKFHSPCLYKWFSTSNKSTCPICRNIF